MQIIRLSSVGARNGRLVSVFIGKVGEGFRVGLAVPGRPGGESGAFVVLWRSTDSKEAFRRFHCFRRFLVLGDAGRVNLKTGVDRVSSRLVSGGIPATAPERVSRSLCKGFRAWGVRNGLTLSAPLGGILRVPLERAGWEEFRLDWDSLLIAD